MHTLLLWLLSPLALAANNPEEVKLRPIVSPSGIQRIYDNIKVIEQNIKDTQFNITACEKNRGVALTELKDLEKLETEQLALAKNYETYMVSAKPEIEKNAESLADIVKWESENKAKLTGAQSQGIAQVDLASKLNAARTEKTRRETWKVDAEKKMERVNKLVEAAKQNLRDIQARRAPLRGQASAWTQRQNEFKKMLLELTTRKSDLERVAEIKKKELPPDLEAK